MSANQVAHAPLLLNLTGQFTIPVQGTEPVSGSVSGDLRLASLDAFLSCLADQLAPGTTGEAVFAKAVTELLLHCAPDVLVKNDVILSITTGVDRSTQTLINSFKFSVAPK